jgi:hypothetical protein
MCVLSVLLETDRPLQISAVHSILRAGFSSTSLWAIVSGRPSSRRAIVRYNHSSAFQLRDIVVAGCGIQRISLKMNLVTIYSRTVKSRVLY